MLFRHFASSRAIHFLSDGRDLLPGSITLSIPHSQKTGGRQHQ
jgi:hypothetical protein